MVSFFGSFLSYLLLMVIIVCVAAVIFIVGRVLRNNKDRSAGKADVSGKSSSEDTTDK